MIVGQYLSNNQSAKFEMSSDCTGLLYDANTLPYVTPSNGDQASENNCYLKMQANCTLVMYRRNSAGVTFSTWASNPPNSNTGCQLVLTNTTTLIIVNSLGATTNTLYIPRE